MRPIQRPNLNIVPDGAPPKSVIRAHDVPLSNSIGRDRLAMRGRTIYNANLAPSDADNARGDFSDRIDRLTALEQLQRIDAEETKRKELMPMGCSACSGRYLGVSFCNNDEPTTGSQVREGDDMAIREMFDLYIRVEECMG